jgi:general secretion pathway protein K
MIDLRRQRGVALLVAILLVALGTILAASIAFKSAMGARRGAASLSFDESVLVAEGAEALAAYALKNDGGNDDNLAESWAQPLPPTEILPGVTLAAALEDLEGRFNLNSLVSRKEPVDKTGVADPDAIGIFERLLVALDLEAKWAAEIADWIAQGDRTLSNGLGDNDTTGQTPPYRVPNTFITSTSELLALPGFGRERYLKLAPYIAALPPEARVNVCMASGILLDAMLEHQDFSTAPTFEEDRKKKCWPGRTNFLAAVNDATLTPKLTPRINEKSEYFRLTSLVTIGDAEFTLYSLIKRERSGGAPAKIRVLQRSFTPD